MKSIFALFVIAVTALSVSSVMHAAVPQIISYQCRIATDGVNFTGTGQFKFALVNAAGTTTFWSNDGSSSAGGQPNNAVPLAVSNGLCSALLGNTSLTNMTAIPVSVFSNIDVRLRVWFNDGSHGWQQLTPDERIAAVGYAMVADAAATVNDGAITAAKFAAGAVAGNLNADGAAGVPSGGLLLSAKEDPSLVAAGYIKLGTTSSSDSWNSFVWKPGGSPTTGTSPSTRHGHTAVWTGTGSRMVVWGGNENGNWLGDGGSYQPALNGWTATGSSGTPTARVRHAAVWTGSEMIIWGGQDRNADRVLPTDLCRYNPVSNIWTTFPSANAPEGRTYHSAVWTGTELIVWGGIGTGAAAVATATITSGAVTAVTVTNAGRGYSSAPMVIFSGGGGGSGAAAMATITSGTVTAVTVTNAGSGYTTNPTVSFSGNTSVSLNSGGRYNPSNNTWTPINTNGAPAARRAHTAVWTGDGTNQAGAMIIWGGVDPPNWLNNGARYNPASDTWSMLASTDAPSARSGHTAIWTGGEMIVWGGEDGSNRFTDLRRYNPATNSWTTGTSSDAPAGRSYHSAVWTGEEMIVWGGFGNEGFLNIGGRYNVSNDRWTVINAYGAPAARWAHTAEWTGTEMIVWGGEGYNGYINDTWYLTPMRTMVLYQKP